MLLKKGLPALLSLLWMSFSSQHWLLGKAVEGFGGSEEGTGVVLGVLV